MATIKKRNNSYQITVSCGYDSSGRQIRKTTTFIPPEGTTPKKAEKLVKEFAEKFQKRCEGKPDYNENMRFSELIALYKEIYIPEKLKAVTGYTYIGQIDKYLLPEFGNVQMKNFNVSRITNFFKSVKLKPATCKKLLTILQSIYSFGYKQGYLSEKIDFSAVILPKEKEEESKPVITESELSELMRMLNADEVRESQFSAIIQTLLYSGMRSGEALALCWDDIDFVNNTIHIHKNLVYDGKTTFLDTTKTKKSKRYIALGKELKQLLLNHQYRQSVVSQEIGKGFNPNNLVFTSRTGNFKDRRQLLREFKAFIKGTSFDDLTLHKLRHANATMLLAEGVDLKLVSEHLGHSGVSITGDLYCDVLLSSKRKMADLVSLKLSGF